MVVKTPHSEAVAAAISVAARPWPCLLNEFTDTATSPHLPRPETRTTACDLIRALLTPLTRKNGWTLAEHAGHGSPTECSTCSTGPAWTKPPWPHTSGMGGRR